MDSEPYSPEQIVRAAAKLMGFTVKAYPEDKIAPLANIELRGPAYSMGFLDWPTALRHIQNPENLRRLTQRTSVRR